MGAPAVVNLELTIMIGTGTPRPCVITQRTHDGGPIAVFGPFADAQSAETCLPSVRDIADEVGHWSWEVVPLVNVQLIEPADEPYTMHAFPCDEHNTTHEIEVTQDDLVKLVTLLARSTPHGDPRCPSLVLAKVRA